MGNLRQSMTEEEWNAMGLSMGLVPDDNGLLLNIIDTTGEPNILANIPIPDNVSHPKHYGGKDNPYEAIKVIDAWGLDFCLGNVVKYVSRAGKKNESALEDLEKAKWYICHAIEKIKKDAG
jgi:hypothetical protein